MVQIQRLVDVVAALRAPNGCPWDREQTHRSLTPFLIEEAYECAEAIETLAPGDDAGFIDELGDVLLQVVLHSQIATETQRFSLSDVALAITEKMIRRHPHVFTGPESRLDTAEEVLIQWQQIKETEKRAPIGFNFGLPLALPALTRAAKIGEKTKRLRFDWPDASAVFNKVQEEFEELKEALKESLAATSSPARPSDEPAMGPSPHALRHEIGDLLFSVAQLARHAGLEPEQCLRDCTHRFERRFQSAMQIAANDEKTWLDISDDERESYWDRAKKLEKAAGL